MRNAVTTIMQKYLSSDHTKFITNKNSNISANTQKDLQRRIAKKSKKRAKKNVNCVKSTDDLKLKLVERGENILLLFYFRILNEQSSEDDLMYILLVSDPLGMCNFYLFYRNIILKAHKAYRE